MKTTEEVMDELARRQLRDRIKDENSRQKWDRFWNTFWIIVTILWAFLLIKVTSEKGYFQYDFIRATGSVLLLLSPFLLYVHHRLRKFPYKKYDNSWKELFKKEENTEKKKNDIN